MLSYNDMLAHSQPAEASCVVCHDLTPADLIIWHEVRSANTWPKPVVPICVDCATMFHDVKSERS